MSRLRVAVDGRALTEPIGGLRRYADEVLSRLPSLDPDIDWQLAVQRSITVPHENYSLTVLPGSLNTLLRARWEDVKLARELSLGSADVLFSPYGIVPNVDIPVVAMVHDIVALRLPKTLPWHHRRYWRRVARRLPGARHVLTNSAATADDVTEFVSIPSDRITVTHLAPSSAFVPSRPEQVATVLRHIGLEQPYVLAVGAGTPRKDLAPVVAAVASIPDLKMVTIGRTHVSGMAHHLGAVDDETLSVVITGARAVVCPSHLEGFGLPIVEAMACGTPVVASATPAVEEVALDAAILIPIARESAWRDALMALHHDPRLRQKYREAGLARSQQFSWQDTARVTLETIRAALLDSPGVR